MIAVITGDIIASRRLVNQDKWLIPLKSLFSKWGDSPKTWNLERGDFFQVEIHNPEDAVKRALEIKALIKKVAPLDERKKMSSIDVRLAIGIGEKTYFGESISESNGPAFIFSGEKYDLLDKENVRMGLKSPWPDFDEEMNLYLKLAGTIMDKWSVSSAELVEMVLHNPNLTQAEIGEQIGIKQNSVSGRWNRAYVNEIIAVERMFRKKAKKIIS